MKKMFSRILNISKFNQMKWLVVVLACIAYTTNVFASRNATGYAKLSLSVATTNQGKVYAATSNASPTDDNAWQDKDTLNHSASGRVSMSKQYVEVKTYAFAKPSTGYTFKEWQPTFGNVTVTNFSNTANPATLTIRATSEDQNAPTSVECAAIFAPIITVPADAKDITISKEGNQEGQEKVSISLYNAVDFQIESIVRTEGNGTGMITCSHTAVNGVGAETPELTITTTEGVVSGDKFRITLTATNGAVGYINVEVQAEVQIIFAKPTVGQGSYTATRADNSGWYATLSHESVEDKPVTMTKATEYTYNVVAKPATGYRFRRWCVERAGEILYFYGNDYTYKVINGDKFYAEFIKEKDDKNQYYAQFIILGTDTEKYKYNHLDDAIAEAQRQNLSTVAVYKAGTEKDVSGVKLMSGTYTIPAGITFLVPGNQGYTVRLGYAALSDYNVDAKSSTCHRKLVVEENTTINVEGNISVYAVISSAMGYTGQPYTYGEIKLLSGSQIIAKSGSKVTVYGYISGDYSNSFVEIQDGAEVYETFQFTDWRGGSAVLFGGLIGNKQRVLPMSQYYVQNIETMLKVQYGGKMHLATAVSMSGSSLPAQTVFINEITGKEETEQGLFCLGQGAEFQKYYDGNEDRLKIKVVGLSESAAVKFSYIYMQITGDANYSGFDVPVDETVDSRQYVLPVTNNIDIEVDNIELILPFEVAFLAGSSLTVTDDAALRIQNKVYVYDKELNVQPDSIAGYFGSQNSPLMPINYTAYHGGKPNKRSAEKLRYPANLNDATFFVDGTMTMEGNGVLYTTYYDADKNITMSGLQGDATQWAKDFGANITSHGGGVMNYYAVGAQAKTYQISQWGTSVKGNPTIPVHNARLRNNDGTFSGGENAKVGETYMYFENEGKWLKPDAEIRQWIGDSIGITLPMPKDTIQNIVCDVVEYGVEILGWEIAVSGEQFSSATTAAGDDYEYDDNAKKLTIPVKYTKTGLHNVSTPQQGNIAIKITYKDPLKGTLEKNVNIPLKATENYKPAFSVTINEQSVIHGGTYDAIIGTGVGETTPYSVVITPSENNVAQSNVDWIAADEATAEPFAFVYGETDETKLSHAKLYYTPQKAGTDEGTLMLKASYTDAANNVIDTTVVINLNATVSLKPNTLAFASFPEKIYDDVNITPAFTILNAASNNAGSKITITASPEGIVAIEGSGVDAKLKPVSMGTVTITAEQDPSVSIYGKIIDTTITIISDQELLKHLTLCLDNLQDFNIHTISGSNVSFNTETKTIDFNSTTAGSEWIFQFLGTPEQISFTPNGTNTWNIQERASSTAPWTNVAAWTTFVANEKVTLPLLPTTCQIRIQYGVATPEVGTLSNICVDELSISANVRKLYLPIYHKVNKVSEKKITFTHTGSAPQFAISNGLNFTASTPENKGTETNPYYHTVVTVLAESTTLEGTYTLTATDDDKTTSVEIQAYHYPHELPIKLAEDDNDEIYYFVTDTSTYAQWNATSRQIVFQNPGAVLPRSVTFAFNGAPDIITFDASINIVDSVWTIEESVDGTPGSFFESSLINRDSLEGTTFVHKLNYRTRYVRLTYNSIETREIALSNLVIEGYPKVIVSPQSMMLGTEVPQQLLTITAINLQKINFVLEDGDAFTITTDIESFAGGTNRIEATDETHPDALGINKVDTITLGVSWLQKSALDEDKITLYNGEDNSVLAVVLLLGSDDYLIKEKANNSGIYTGIPDGTRDVNNDGVVNDEDKYTYHGKEYSDYLYHQVDLTNTFADDGTALFDYLFIYGETTPRDGNDITAPQVGSADGSTNIGSNAVTPFFIYKKAANTDGLYKGYQFVSKVENVNASDKALVEGIIIKDTATVYIDVQDKLSVYITGFAPYATTGYDKLQEGVFLFRGTHGAKLDVYLEDCHIFSRNKTKNGNAFYGNKDGGETFSEKYARGSGGVLVFENIDAQQLLNNYTPFEVNIHTMGNNLLKSNYGCFYILLGSMKAYQISAPIHVHLNSDAHVRMTKTTLNFDDLWPTALDANNLITDSKRTNGYLGLKKQSNNAPSIDLGSPLTVANFKGGRVELQNAQIVSPNYKTTLAISHRSGYYGGDEAGIQLSFGIGTDSVGGTVNFLDGTVTVEPMWVKEGYKQYYLIDTLNGSEIRKNVGTAEKPIYEYQTSCLRTPKNTYVRGGSHCRIRACQHVTSKGGAPKDKEKGSFLGQYVYTKADGYTLDPVTKLVTQINFPDNVSNLLQYHASRGYTYGLHSITPDADGNLYFWIPDGFGGVEAEQDKFLSTWKACMTEIRAGLAGVVEGGVGGDTPVEPNEEIKYFLYCQIDKNIHRVINRKDSAGNFLYQAPVAVPPVAKKYFDNQDYTTIAPTQVGDSLQYQVTSDTAYTITDRVYYVTTATADIWQTFTAPFDVENIYVVETYNEEALAEIETRSEILLEQARHNADFAAFFAVAMAIGTTDDFEGIYKSYIKWAKNQDGEDDNANYTKRGKKELIPYIVDPATNKGNWRDANFYLNHNAGNWVLTDEESYEVQWEMLTASDTTDGILLHKGETYSLMFPYCPNCEAEGSLDSRTDWDYWSGKFLIFESTAGAQVINGRDFLNDTIEGNVFTQIPDVNEVIVTGNSTFAQLEPERDNVYVYNSNAPFMNSETFEPKEFVTDPTIYPTTAFLYGNVPTDAQGMPARGVKRTGEIIYDKENTSTDVNPGGNIPTVGGGNDLFITSTVEGINIAVAEPQHVRVLSSTGAVLYSGMVQTAVDVALPTTGVYVITGENEVHKILH